MEQKAQRVAAVVKAALECEPGAAREFVEEACAGDDDLRAEVDSLLAFRGEASCFIEKPALHVVAEMLAREESLGREQLIAGYRVLSKIGGGGMGDVYLAEDVELHRKVALKLVRPSMSTAEIVSRFRHEEQILASLNHPNIAQLYGAGETSEGTPFFVMEYVEGARIDFYCRREKLSTNARLQLFRKVCSAVHYAHQHLVIHRDLKPSNMLVSESGEPKLLDFGIAKLLDTPGVPAALAPTLLRVMTPDYASPEQVRGEAITTASDVYSLGVLLYELLTGRRPHRTASWRPDQVAGAVTEVEPVRPSSAFTPDPETPQFDLPNPKSLRGDLDNIILMALRKEPERRYSSVAQFAGDIARHLEGLPVIARKDTVAYRTTKFLGRNKIATAAAGIILFALLAGIAATTWQAKKAFAQRDRARREAAKAERVTTFLQNVLGFSSPAWNSSNPERNRNATISDALLEAARRAEAELVKEPEALAAVHFTIGNTYRVQSRYPEAEPHLRAALDLRRRVLGPQHQETAQSLVALAEWCVVTGHYGEAEPLFFEAIATFRNARDTKWLSIALNDMGTLKWYRGEYGAAEDFLRQALAVSSDLVGPDRATRAIMYSTLGLARRDQGDLAQAADFLQKSIEEHRALPGEPRMELALALNNLASVAFLQEDDERARTLSLEAFDLYQKTLGENHQSTASPLILLAEIQYRRGDYAQAREQIEHAIAIQTRALPPEHIDLARSRVTLGKILAHTGDLAAAESCLRTALERLAQSLPAGHLIIAGAQGALGECLVLQKRYAEAEPLLTSSHAAFNKSAGPADLRTKTARQRLFMLYDQSGRPDMSEHYR